MDIEFYKNLATENISDLPYLPLCDKSKLPSRSAIYFVVDSQKNIQYIGRSINLKQRWQNHHKLNEFEAIGNIKIVYLFVDAEYLDIVESALIEYLLPPLNYQGYSPKETVETVKLTIFLKEKDRKDFKVLCAENDISMSAQVEQWIIEANAARKSALKQT